MNNILAKHELKLKKSQQSKLKLSDVITLKNKIKKKLLREIQGLRTSSSNFKEIKNLNPDDLKRIITQIKKKLNY